MAQLAASVFDRVIAVDLRGVFLCMKYQFRHMLRARKGTIVNTASVAGCVETHRSAGALSGFTLKTTPDGRFPFCRGAS